MEIDKKNKTITAYHESGHAIVAYYTKDAMPINKATIMPRGPTLGHVIIIKITGFVVVDAKIMFHKNTFRRTLHLCTFIFTLRCLCSQKTIGGVRLVLNCWLRWMSAWAAGWQKSSSLGMKTSLQVGICTDGRLVSYV